METEVNYLLANGWREYPNQFKDYARCFYKQFETPTRCFGNSDKPGIQIEVSVSEFSGRDPRTSIELELCGGFKDDSWVKIQNYSFQDKKVEKVVSSIPRLLAMWEAGNNFK